MAHFRGTIKGARGEASRLGHKGTGLRVNAASWQGAVDVQLWHDETTGNDMARVSLAKHHGAGIDVMLYEGPVRGKDFPINVNPTKAEMQDAVSRLLRRG